MMHLPRASRAASASVSCAGGAPRRCHASSVAVSVRSRARDVLAEHWGGVRKAERGVEGGARPRVQRVPARELRCGGSQGERGVTPS